MKEDKKYLGKDVLSKVDNAFNSFIDEAPDEIKDSEFIALIYIIKISIMKKLMLEE